jgi:hypothetical protein
METLASLLQQQAQHRDGMEHAHALHKAELQHQEFLHRQECDLDRQRFVEAETLALDLQHAKLKLAVGLAERDAVRDALAHRSQVTQSIMLVNAVMLGCDYMMVYQINLPHSLKTAGSIVYTAFLGLSIPFILASIALALALQQRIIMYDLHKQLRRYQPCGKTHSSFSSYFECHCRWYEKWGLRTFYAGTVCVMAAASTMLYALLAIQYGLVGIGVGTVIGIGVGAAVLVTGDFFVPSQTHAGPEDLVGGGDYGEMFAKIRAKRRDLKTRFHGKPSASVH